jgi:hypothetical protein
VWGEAQATAFLGVNSEIRGDYDQALSYYQASIALLERIHDVIYESVARGVLAGARASHGDGAAASTFYEEVRRIVEHASMRWAVGRTLQAAAFNVQYNYHLLAAAKVLYQGSLLLWRDMQRLESGFSVVRSLVGIAEILAVQHDVQHAGWLLGAADRLAAPSGIYRAAFDQRVARARETLAPAMITGFDAAWRDGQTATPEQTIEVALRGV